MAGQGAAPRSTSRAPPHQAPSSCEIARAAELVDQLALVPAEASVLEGGGDGRWRGERRLLGERRSQRLPPPRHRRRAARATQELVRQLGGVALGVASGGRWSRNPCWWSRTDWYVSRPGRDPVRPAYSGHAEASGRCGGSSLRQQTSTFGLSLICSRMDYPARTACAAATVCLCVRLSLFPQPHLPSAHPAARALSAHSHVQLSPTAPARPLGAAPCHGAARGPSSHPPLRDRPAGSRNKQLLPTAPRSSRCTTEATLHFGAIRFMGTKRASAGRVATSVDSGHRGPLPARHRDLNPPPPVIIR